MQVPYLMNGGVLQFIFLVRVKHHAVLINERTCGDLNSRSMEAVGIKALSGSAVPKGFARFLPPMTGTAAHSSHNQTASHCHHRL